MDERQPGSQKVQRSFRDEWAGFEKEDMLGGGENAGSDLREEDSTENSQEKIL